MTDLLLTCLQGHGAQHAQPSDGRVVAEDQRCSGGCRHVAVFPSRTGSNGADKACSLPDTRLKSDPCSHVSSHRSVQSTAEGWAVDVQGRATMTRAMRTLPVTQAAKQLHSRST